MMRGPIAVVITTSTLSFARRMQLAVPRQDTRVTLTSAAVGCAAMTSAVKTRSSLSIMGRIILAMTAFAVVSAGEGHSGRSRVVLLRIRSLRRAIIPP